MTIPEYLVSFLSNDFLIVSFVLGGALVITGWSPRRKNWCLRTAAAFGVMMLWMMLTLPLFNDENFPKILAGILRYLGLYFLAVCGVLFVSRMGFFTALYAVTVSYGLQNMCERLVEIPRIGLSYFPLLLDRTILLTLMLVSLAVYCKAAVWDGRYLRYCSFQGRDRKIAIFISASVISVCIVLDILTRRIQYANTVEVANIINALMAICSALAVLTATSFSREAESERRASIANHILAQDRERYTREKAAQDAINIRCHDIRHQIAAMGQEGYRSSLKELDKLVRIYDDSVNTGSTALDVVLYEKQLICQAQDITLTCFADGKKLTFLSDGDIYALFGNMLENAICAVSNIPEPDRRQISLTVRAEGGFLMIEEENCYLGELEFQDGLPMTSNSDRENHGFGMQSIRQTVERYGGSMRIQAEDGTFFLSLMFPL